MRVYHESPAEQSRVRSLLDLLPAGLGSTLDIGARDGHITRLLAERIPQVTALDLTMPSITDSRIRCVQGDATRLPFADNHFDLVFCAEVLEHIPPPLLPLACRELSRVTRRYVLIGVPYRQDIRCGRVTCGTCGRAGPPWGHVNSLDEQRLGTLFSGLRVAREAHIGTAPPGTNALSAWLMDRAGNPYGTYTQEEGCVHCGAALSPPPRRTLLQRAMTRSAVRLRDLQAFWYRPHANWIHVLFEKPAHPAPTTGGTR